MNGNCIPLKVLTPLRQVVSADVDAVFLPGYLGELGILPGHTPLLALLGIGELRYTIGGRDHYLVISGGFAEVGDDKVLVQADVAETPEEIDVAHARQEQKEAEALLKTTFGDNLSTAQARLARAHVRIKVAERNT
jgi:F-type H+-transporting ATPase subunit epsilon